MKYLQLYEDFKPSEDWKIGDIVVALEDKYAGDTYWLKCGEKYEIVEIPFNNVIKVKKISGRILRSNFFKNIFMTEEEWNITKKRDKYNI